MILSPPFVKWAFPSFIKRYEVVGAPYLVGLARLPTNRSRSPSWSTSATATQDLFSKTTDIGSIALVKCPVPSLINNLSNKASSFAGTSLPPVSTNKSWKESPLASKKMASTSSLIAYFSLNVPSFCCIIITPG